MVSAFCIVLVATVWCAYFLKLEKLAGKRFDKIEERVRDLQGEAREMEVVESEIALIEKKKTELIDLSAIRSRRLKLVQAIHKQLPQGMWITSLSGKDKDSSTGYASNSPADERDKEEPDRVLELLSILK